MTPSPPVEPPAHEAAPPPLMSAEEVAELRGLIAQPVTPADLLRFDAVQIKGVIYVEETQLRAVVQKALALNAPFRLAAPSLLSTAERAIAMREALGDYHAALDAREHGGVAQSRLAHRIEEILGCPWVQGAETERRAALSATPPAPAQQNAPSARLSALEEENARLRSALRSAEEQARTKY